MLQVCSTGSFRPVLLEIMQLIYQVVEGLFRCGKSASFIEQDFLIACYFPLDSDKLVPADFKPVDIRE